MAGTLTGRFIPKHPEKYIGNVNRVIFRSSWERRFMIWLDGNNAVLRWGSEELAIPYINPIKVDAAGRPKISRYFPDFIILYRDNSGGIKKEIVEIKPYKESVITPRMSERDKMAYVVNQAKWKAAAMYAAANGAEFRVVTERSLFQQAAPTKKMGTNL
jgi:hypothetical protein